MARTIEGVEIFAEGTWYPGNLFGMPVKFTAEDMDGMARETNRRLSRHRVPLKLGHDPNQVLDQGDGQPALGHAENFRAGEGEGPDGRSRRIVTCDFIDVPDEVASAISAGLYTDVSAEAEHFEGLGWVVTAVALLGADLPAVKGLEDLRSYLSARNLGGDPASVSAAQFSRQHPTFRSIDMDAEQLKQQLDEERRARQEAEQKLTASEGELERQRQRQMDAAFAEAKRKALEPIDQRVQAGSVTPALRDKIAAALDEQQASFSEGHKLAVPVELSLELSEQLPKGEDGQDPGGGAGGSGTGDRADYALTAKVHEYQASHPGMTFTDAAEHVKRTHPELVLGFVQAAPEIGGTRQ